MMTDPDAQRIFADMTDAETLRAIAENIREEWPGDAMALERLAVATCDGEAS